MIFQSGILNLKSLHIHTLFDKHDKYLNHMLVKFEQNRRSYGSNFRLYTQNVELFDKKWLIIFDKALTPILEDVSVMKQLFDAKLSIWILNHLSGFKNYGSPTRVTIQVKSCSISMISRLRKQTVTFNTLMTQCYYFGEAQITPHNPTHTPTPTHTPPTHTPHTPTCKYLRTRILTFYLGL